MSDILEELKYTEEHEWVRDEGNGMATIGITDHAQSQLGDVVYVELPEVGARYAAGDACALVESVKAASDVYNPLDGEVTAVNDSLNDNPQSVNHDPYGDGWLYRLKVSDTDLSHLMSAEEYAALVAEEE